MTKHSPIATPDQPQDSGRSLLERAARAYAFDDIFRASAPAPAPVPVESAPQIVTPPAPAPVAPAETVAPETDTQPVSAMPVHAPVWDGPVESVDTISLAEQGYIVPGGSVTAMSEEFRIVKRQLLRNVADIHGKSATKAHRILIGSALPGEGKTFCAVNLALSMAAEQDMDVLLVDADFGKPSVMKALGLERDGFVRAGLMDALLDPSIDVEGLVIRTDVPNLSVLPAGRAVNNDTEILASASTVKVLDALSTGHRDRIILFDSPPALAASPAAALATHVGQLLIIVRADQTSENALRDAVGLLSGCETIQLLLNGVKFSTSGRRFGSYYGKGA